MAPGPVRKGVAVALMLAAGLLALNAQHAKMDSVQQVLLHEYQAILQHDLYSREKPANQFYAHFARMLQQYESFEYPFDTLKNIGSVYSPDQRLRIFTWNIPSGFDNIYD